MRAVLRIYEKHRVWVLRKSEGETLSAIVAIFEIPFASGAITAAVRRSWRHVSGALHSTSERVARSQHHRRAAFTPRQHHTHRSRAPRSRLPTLSSPSPLCAHRRLSSIANELEVEVERPTVALERPAELLDVAVRLGAPARIRVRPQIVARLARKLTDRPQRQVVRVERVLHVRVEVLRDAVVVAAEVDRRFAPGILDPGGTSHT